MGSRFLFRLTALAVAMAMVVLGAGVALADNLSADSNDLNASTGQSRAHSMTTAETATIDYFISSTGTKDPAYDGKGNPYEGCDATADSPATVTVTAPGAVTVNAVRTTLDESSLTAKQVKFTGCGTNRQFTFSSSTAGIYAITASVTDALGYYETTNASFTLTVTTAAPTAPVDPCVTASAPAAPAFTAGSPNGDNGWFKATVPASVPSAAATSTTSDAVITYSTDGTTFSSTTPTLSQGTTTVTAKASAATCATKSSTTARTFKIDTTAPSISDEGPTTQPNTAGWYKTAVTNTFGATDTGGSGLANCDPSFTKSSGTTEGDAVKIGSGTCTDQAGNEADSLDSAAFKIDTTAPSVTDAGPTTQPNAAGWYKTEVTNTFTASDTGGSGLATDCPASFTKSSGTTQGDAVNIASGACSDVAGNSNTGIDSAAFKIDGTDPSNLTFVDGPNAGTTYYFGAVPAAPSCTADDALSLFAGCTVTGHSSGIGTHTMTATATDHAGNTGTLTRSYTVAAWTLKGFYSPVDLGIVVNTAKAGSTVPLKFEIFAGPTELTETSAIDTFTVAKAPCGSAYGGEDSIEQYVTGGTSLRYDTTGGQFIQNWKVPAGSNTCYRVTMTADDGSATSALFKTK